MMGRCALKARSYERFFKTKTISNEGLEALQPPFGSIRREGLNMRFIFKTQD